jgi:RNA polymerase sigma-70 factor (ECF subfamily)
VDEGAILLEDDAREPSGVPPTDGALILEMIAGSEDALAILYERHSSAIFARALRLTRDRSAAEEILQETFLALWDRAELFDSSRGSLAGWLLTIARNRSVDRVRAAARRAPAAPFSSLLGDGLDDAASLDWLLETSEPLGGSRAEPGPEMAALTAETRAAVRAAVAALDPRERHTILLAYRDGLSQSEIASRLGWPLGTVKTRTRRALQALRLALERSATENSGEDAATLAAPSRAIRWTDQG